jgi:hypothetical protein
MDMDFLKDFSDNTRVWIYQSPREFSPSEQEWLMREANAFTGTWNAHGSPVKATVGLLHNRFIIVAADQEFTPNSGCSIDASVNFIRKAEQYLNVDLMDRRLVTYVSDGTLHTARLDDLPGLYKKGIIRDDSVVFNTLADSKLALEQEWEKNLAASWHYRFIQ